MKDTFNLHLLRPLHPDHVTVIRLDYDDNLEVQIEQPFGDPSSRVLFADEKKPRYKDFLDHDTIVSNRGATFKHTLSVAVRLFRLQGLLPKSLS